MAQNHGIFPGKILSNVNDRVMRIFALCPSRLYGVIQSDLNKTVLRNLCLSPPPATEYIARARRRRQIAIGLVERDLLLIRCNRTFSSVKRHGIGVGRPLGVERKVARDRRREVVLLRASRIRVPTREGIARARGRFRRLCNRRFILCRSGRDLAAAIAIKRHGKGDRSAHRNQRHLGFSKTLLRSRAQRIIRRQRSVERRQIVFCHSFLRQCQRRRMRLPVRRHLCAQIVLGCIHPRTVHLLVDRHGLCGSRISVSRNGVVCHRIVRQHPRIRRVAIIRTGSQRHELLTDPEPRRKIVGHQIVAIRARANFAALQPRVRQAGAGHDFELRVFRLRRLHNAAKGCLLRDL